MAATVCTVRPFPAPAPPPSHGAEAASPAQVSLPSRALPRAPPAPNLPPPAPSQQDSREGAGLGRGWGVDASVCHGGGRRKGRGETGSEGERARSERGGRAGGGSSYLGRARSLAARLPGPRVTWGGRQVRTHWPPRRSARRARPQAAAPRTGSASPAAALGPGPGSPPALVGLRGRSVGLRGCAPRPGHSPGPGGGAPAHHGGSARPVPAPRPPPEPQRRLSAVRQAPAPPPRRPPARPSAAAVYGAAPRPGSCTETSASGFFTCFSALASST